MNSHPRPRQLRRRKSLRLAHTALLDHEHAHLRGIALAAIVLLIAVAVLWRRDAPPAPADETIAAGASTTPVRTASVARPAAIARELLPLVTVTPEYPAAAEATGISGRCTVEFTVTAAGTTRDVRPVDCTPPGMFEAAAVAAARQFKYRPRERDGQAVDAPGIRNEFVFSLAR